MYFDDKIIKIEVYSPTESYAFQLFSTRLKSLIKNLDVGIGFDLGIESKSDSVDYTYRFPPFRDVLKWLSEFESKFVNWLLAAEEGNTKLFKSPLEGYLLNITVNRKDSHAEDRLIIWGGATYSTDLKLYFEISDPERFSKTNVGKNIFNKLSKQQAGNSSKDVLRIFIINFAHADSSDLSFLNNKKTQIIIENDIKFIASSIKPFPPYDIVIASEIGSQCGFSNNVVLDKDKMEDFSSYFELLGFDNPIKKIRRASEEEERQMFEDIMKFSDENS
ncbi:MAG: hypothetical protein IIB95_08600 [Candidatus Marinimicrobia bacterium]|nr:hypothetical protein [Candidatus Neomarinimicrobiota bacterium]